MGRHPFEFCQQRHLLHWPPLGTLRPHTTPEHPRATGPATPAIAPEPAAFQVQACPCAHLHHPTAPCFCEQAGTCCVQRTSASGLHPGGGVVPRLLRLRPRAAAGSRSQHALLEDIVGDGCAGEESDSRLGQCARPARDLPAPRRCDMAGCVQGATAGGRRISRQGWGAAALGQIGSRGGSLHAARPRGRWQAAATAGGRAHG